MKKTRIDKFQLDITDPIAFARRPENLVETLTAQYVGRCHEDHIIRSIDEILRRSPIESTRNNPSKYTMYAEARTTGESLSPGHIISAAKVMGIIQVPPIIFCRASNIDISLEESPLLKVLAVGNVIPVRVIDSQYPPGKTSMTVVGELYSHVHNVLYYKLSGPHAPRKTPALEEVMQDARDEEALCADLRASRLWGFFAKIFDAYDRTKGVQKTAPFSTIWDFIEKGSIAQYIGRDSRLDLTVASVATTNEVQSDNTARQGLTHDTIAINLLYSYIQYLRLMRESCETYSDETRLKEHQSLWSFYNVSKKKL